MTTTALKWLRLRRGLSQQHFVGVVSREHLSRLERGVSQPNLQLIRDLAKVLEVHPMSLMTLAFQLSDGLLPFVDLVQVIASELEIDLGDS
ncbi:helix-turn-helix domain-containing protein [Pseudomonas viridiflava]|uniref:helix-turn-helix domain-containing protein n=1 Tax=Pseudomonas viridiflava TaxID=33069 RepID=UPI000F034B4E